MTMSRTENCTICCSSAASLADAAVAVRDRHQKLADVPARTAVWARLRYRERNQPARHFGGAGLGRSARLVILVFPALFTAGMSLVDAADGILMVQAYGWAFHQPVRKLYYNLTMT